MDSDQVSVKVDIRVRPLGAREVIDCCRVCTNFIPGEPQIVLGSDKAFTYDNVYDFDVSQREIFETSIMGLIDSCFEGLNATILAYGQTGSGKTYTMGTQFDDNIREQQRGIIPRAVGHLFNKINELKVEAEESGLPAPEFKATAQFLELYNEEILDLLSPSGQAKGKKSNLRIHEDGAGEIYVEGMSTQDVSSAQEVLDCLKQGALSRTTACTEMNSVSSRSHAMFTLRVSQMRAVKSASDDKGSAPEFENLSAKLVFVDLAGSERLKRTGATGDRAKEGISINSGLLVLGNVISALGDEKRKASHVPYRDSKLTRLLQDSLGGNSQTLMMACVSPADRDFMETLNTLKYANRAKNIKNKVVVNQDKTSRIINSLREQNVQLQQELMEYKMGQRTGEEGGFSDMFSENSMLRADNDKLRLRIKSMKEAQDVKDNTIAGLRAKTLCANISASGETDMTEMVQGYLKEIETLRSQLLEKGSSTAYKSPQRPVTRMSMGGPLATNPLNSSIDEVIKEAKCDLEKTMAKRSKLARECSEITRIEDNKENETQANGDTAGEDSESDEEMEVEDLEDEEEKGEEEKVDEEEDMLRDQNLQDLEENLADLTDEISLKQKLVEELEKSQKKIMAMKQQYEEKLHLLNNQIQVTCDERDKVMTSLKTKGDSGKNNEEIKTKSAHYAKKLKDMEIEMKRLKSAHREHDRLVTTNKNNEKNLKNMHTEISLMKKNKVKLMRQLREDTAKAKLIEMKRQQEICKLQRDKQKQSSTIKKLQMEKKTKEAVLKRKQEEIKMMKKQKQTVQQKRRAARRGPHEEETAEDRHARRLSSQYSSFSARQKWNQLEKRMCQNIIRKHTISQMEADMGRLVNDRDKLEKDLDQFIKSKDKLLRAKHIKEDEVQALDENIEGLRMQVEYLEENINDHQGDIVEMMEGRENTDTIDLQDIIDSSSLSDCKYLLEHFLTYTSNKGLAAAQSNMRVKEAEGQVKSMKQALEEAEQKLLDQFTREKMMAERDELVPIPAPDFTFFDADAGASNNTTVFNTPSKVVSMLSATPGRKFFPQPSSASPPVPDSRLRAVMEEKTRRRTNTPGELAAASMSRSPSASDMAQSPTTEKKRVSTGGGDVFERLQVADLTPPPQGRISPAPHHETFIPCVCLAKGHTHSVQSLVVADKLMVTGSSDRTIRTWDLTKNTETCRASVGESVKKVVYHEPDRVVYALISSSLKAWDIRTDPSTARTTTLAESPSALLYPKDGGNFIYFSTGISVRSWNIPEWSSAGVLHGHSGHVMCLEHVKLEDKSYIITGSRDHFCKMYDATDGIVSSRVPTSTLNPPHFDGVESVAWGGGHLFSASRDATIKKWHLQTKKEKGTQRPAHKDRVLALRYLDPLSALASVSRDGVLKLWRDICFGAARSDQGNVLIGEMSAHPGSAILDVTYQDNHVYTASSDTTVKVWDISPLL